MITNNHVKIIIKGSYTSMNIPASVLIQKGKWLFIYFSF